MYSHFMVSFETSIYWTAPLEYANYLLNNTYWARGNSMFCGPETGDETSYQMSK